MLGGNVILSSAEEVHAFAFAFTGALSFTNVITC